MSACGLAAGLFTIVVGAAWADDAQAETRPLMREFLGICGHTISFKPKLYRPVVRLVRDYHPFDWDVGDSSANETTFPLARNQVDWDKEVYRPWREAGFDIDVSIMIDVFKPKDWKDPAADAFKYAKAFAVLGPSGKHALVSTAEIGNEPGLYDDALYRTIFENMARGLRAGDPRLKIATCAVTTGKSERYAKSLDCVKGLESLYDIISVHTYSFVEQYPTWRRSFPEDPSIAYLKDVERVIAWRSANAPGKPVWITEFGYDASSKPAPKTGDFAKWQGNTETEQARYLVRSALVFSAMDVARAYIYYFNDIDEPQLHGSSGLTRNYVPKPSYFALAQLERNLGEYRFSRAIARKAGEIYVYEYTHADKPGARIWAVWSPTGSNRRTTIQLPLGGGRLVRAQEMALAQQDVPPLAVRVKDGSAELALSESPIYLWLEASGEPAKAGVRGQ